MKFIATADLHIHSYSKFNEDGRRLKNCLKVLKYLFAIADKADANYILFAGDLFDSQKALPIEVINETVRTFKELFEKYKDVSFISISGNHDYGNKRVIGGKVISSCDFLDQVFDRFILLDDGINKELPEIGTGRANYSVVGVSDYYHAEDFYKMVEDAEDADLLMVHCTAMGYSDFFGSIDPKHECFKRFPLVISGDIHKSKWLAKNFLMLGSPLHRDSGDIGEDKGIWVFDTEDIKAPDFISLNERLPTFIRKVEGDKVEKDELKDYVVWTPVFEPTVEGEASKEDFNTSVAETELVTNFYKEIGEVDGERLEVGLKLIL